MKELANDFEKKNILGKIFWQKKEIRKKVDKVGNGDIITISYKIRFIDSAGFIASPLSNFVDNFAERIRKTQCKDCEKLIKDNLIKSKCISCDKYYSNKIEEEFKMRFKNTFKFSNNDTNKFIFFLRKGIYPYEYMDDMETFHKTSKEEFYSNLNMEDNTDYMHAKRVCKDF